jgi:glucose-6-phosphate isomerase
MRSWSRHFILYIVTGLVVSILDSWTWQGVAITQEGSLLDNTAKIEGWLARFPMFDWVGGRTSEMSAVGLLPAALQVSKLSYDPL